jgi:hypothetical protein
MGPFVRRRVNDNFKAPKRDRYTLAYDWLTHCGKYTNIQHKVNSGKEKKIGRFPVDRYDEATNTVL